MYEKTWESLDARPVPAWFDEAKLGIFIHWGIYSVPAYAPKGCYSEWYGMNIHKKDERYYDFHRRVYGENFRYEDFAGMWKAEMFDADKWAELFRRAGAKYVVMTSKHHDAFCLWPSEYAWNWNSVDIGPHRDLIGELFEATRKQGMKAGAYYSVYEWFHPALRAEDPSRYAVEKMIPQMKELVEKYHPSVLYTDGEWDYSSEDWHSKDFLAWLFNESSMRDEIVVNDRWGKDCRGVHGGFLSCEYGEVNSGAIDEKSAQENLLRHKWEEIRSIGMSFGHNRNEDVEDYLSEDDLIELLVKTVSKGGNLSLNVGPCADGTIIPLVQERLLQLGEWLKVNGEAIYASHAAFEVKVPENVYVTKRDGKIYLIVRGTLPETLSVQGARAAKARLLGSDAAIGCACEGDCVTLTIPKLSEGELPCRGFRVFEIGE